MKNEFALAFNEVLEEKQLPKEVILQALESAMVSAYRRSVNASNAQQVEAKVDPETGAVVIFAEKEVVDAVNDDRTEVSLEEAKKYAEDAEIGMMVMVETTPKNFGRVAAQTARQVIQQRIRDAERQAQFQYYQKQVGEIISGVVQAINSQGLTIGLEMRAEGNMSRKDKIPKERFRIHDRVRALVAEVKETPRGPQINLSRTHRDFLRRLLENEVPEIYHGVVEIRSISREPGERAKVAVSATQSGIDPVGACVGIRGVRIQAIVRELHDEKIDVIEWNDDAAMFISKAISPARVVGVYLNEESGASRTATVVVPEDQLSLAIGRDGQNARLAAKLTGWRIDIKSLSEAAGDALYKVQNSETFAVQFESDQEILSDMESLLARKAEGRPLNPEEYDRLAKFVDRVEKTAAAERAKAQIKEPELLDTAAEIQSNIPEEAFQTNLLDSELPEHISNILQGAGYLTIGDVAHQMELEADVILSLQGIGPKSMEKIVGMVDALQIEVGEAEKEAEDKTEAIAEAQTEQVVESAEEETPSSELEQEETEEEAPTDEISVVEESTSKETEAVLDKPRTQEEELSFKEMIELEQDIKPKLEEEFEDELSDKPKKKKKKRKSVQIEYDPEKDMMVRKKKHKRDESIDEWDWEL